MTAGSCSSIESVEQRSIPYCDHPVTGVRAFHAVYDSATIDLQPLGGLVQYLYAPTTKGPDGDCSEFGTAYIGSSCGTSVDFYVFDVGTRGFEFSVPIEAAFMSTYKRTRSDFTAYNAETIRAGRCNTTRHRTAAWPRGARSENWSRASGRTTSRTSAV